MNIPIVRWFDAPTHWRDKGLAFGARWLVRPLLALPLPWRMHGCSFKIAGTLRRMAPGIRCEPVEIACQTGAVFSPSAEAAVQRLAGFAVAQSKAVA